MGQSVTEVTKDVALTVRLTGREMEVLLFMSKGVPIKEIARLLGVEWRTVKLHQAGLYVKLEASNHCEAIANAFRAGILS